MKVEHIEKFDGLREDEALIGGIASPGPQKGVQNLVNANVVKSSAKDRK